MKNLLNLTFATLVVFLTSCGKEYVYPQGTITLPGNVTQGYNYFIGELYLIKKAPTKNNAITWMIDLQPLDGHWDLFSNASCVSEEYTALEVHEYTGSDQYGRPLFRSVGDGVILKSSLNNINLAQMGGLMNSSNTINPIQVTAVKHTSIIGSQSGTQIGNCNYVFTPGAPGTMLELRYN